MCNTLETLAYKMCYRNKAGLESLGEIQSLKPYLKSEFLPVQICQVSDLESKKNKPLG